MLEKRALTSAEIQAGLQGLSGWESEDGQISKTFRFQSFAAAIGWMVAISIFADKIDHHPEWTNVYSRVMVRLTTHDLDNVVSTLDIALAKEMEKLAEK